MADTIARAGRRVLVVEDDADERELLSINLVSQGLSVKCVGAAGDALDALRAGKFDVVVTDVMLPDGSGLDLAQDIRRLRPGVPVILISGSAPADEAIAGVAQGAHSFVSKPYEMGDLIWLVKKACRCAATESAGAKVMKMGGEAGNPAVAAAA